MSKTVRTKNWVSVEEDNRIWVSTTSYLYCPIFQYFIVIQRYGSWLILRVKSNLPKLIPSQSSQIFDIGIQDLKTAFTEIFKQHKERGKRLKWEVCLHTKLFQKCSTLCDPMDCNRPGSSSWDSPGKNIGVGSHALLKGIFLIQESNPRLLPLQIAGIFFTAELPGKPQTEE